MFKYKIIILLIFPITILASPVNKQEIEKTIQIIQETPKKVRRTTLPPKIDCSQCSKKEKQLIPNYLEAIQLVITTLQKNKKIKFKRIPQQELLAMGLTPQEAKSYARDYNQLTLSFQWLADGIHQFYPTPHKLEGDISKGANYFKLQWFDQIEVLGASSFSAAIKVLKQQTNHK